MPTIHVEGSTLLIETDCYSAQVKTEGYVSGLAAGTFVDRKTGARELGFGLDIVDFLLEPGPDNEHFEPHRYRVGDPYHGNLLKRYVELPQICTQAKQLPYRIIEGNNFVAVQQWYTWTIATAMRRPGSRWEQTLIFVDGQRYFYACDRVTSMNDVDTLFLRIDMPGHLKHKMGDTFHKIFLSYYGEIDRASFFADFPPDERFLYQRNDAHLPHHIIRAYQTRLGDGRPGPWLAGITLDPASVYEAWCHQRGYVCFIQEIGGRNVKAGQEFGAAYAVGYFDSIEAMHQAAAKHKGANSIRVDNSTFKLVP